MPRYLSRDRVAVFAAVVAPLAVCAILLPWRAHISNTNVGLVLVVAVVAVSVAGNRIAGVLTAVFAALWFEFFFTQPYQRFAISKSEDVATAVLLLVVGLAVSQVAARARQLRVITITDAGYLAQIHEAARVAQTATSPNAVIEHVRKQLVDLLSLRGCRFEYGTLTGQPPRLEQDGTIVWGRRHWLSDQPGLPDEDVELRVLHNGRFYGRFMLQPTPGELPPAQARLVAVTLADQAGAALDTGGRLR